MGVSSWILRSPCVMLLLERRNRMRIAHLFNRIMEIYPYSGTKVDSSTEAYDILCRQIPQIIKAELNNDCYDVVGSMGRGNRTDFPWISVLNTRVTTTTQKGIYMVFLFKKDMTGFYLSLNQGITFFDNRYKGKKYNQASLVAQYFQQEITDTSFSTKAIELGGNKGDLGYGYCRTNIISKFYSKNNFTDEMLIADLSELSGIYDVIVSHMGNDSYDMIIEKVLDSEENDFVVLPEAIQEIRNIVDPNNEMPREFVRKIVEVDRPEVSKHYKKISAPSNRKIDYIKKAHNDLKYGLMGEELVLEYEKQRLYALGEIEYANSIKWASKLSDSYGYDILSYDYIRGKLTPIQIEVKTTTSPVDVDFYISINELERSKEYNETYFVYRIYDVNSMAPKMYRAQGEIKKNFTIDPVTFRARYKYPKVVEHSSELIYKQQPIYAMAASDEIAGEKDIYFRGTIS